MGDLENVFNRGGLGDLRDLWDLVDLWFMGEVDYLRVFFVFENLDI